MEYRGLITLLSVESIASRSLFKWRGRAMGSCRKQDSPQPDLLDVSRCDSPELFDSSRRNPGSGAGAHRTGDLEGFGQRPVITSHVRFTAGLSVLEAPNNPGKWNSVPGARYWETEMESKYSRNSPSRLGNSQVASEVIERLDEFKPVQLTKIAATSEFVAGLEGRQQELQLTGKLFSRQAKEVLHLHTELRHA